MSWNHNGNLSNIACFESGKDFTGSNSYVFLKNDNGSTTIYLTPDLNNWSLFNECESSETGVSGAPISCASARDGLFFFCTDSNKVYALTVGENSGSYNVIELAGSHELSAVRTDGHEQLIMCYKNGKIKTRNGTATGNIITERADLSEEYSSGHYPIDVSKSDDGWVVISSDSSRQFHTMIASSDWSEIYKGPKINTPLIASEVNFYNEEGLWKISDGQTVSTTSNLSDWYRSGALLWVAVGRDGHLAWSEDGAQWNYDPISVPGAGNFGTGLVYAAGADGAQGNWVISNALNAGEIFINEDPTDENNWTPIDVPGSYAVYDLAASPDSSTLLACGVNNTVLRSYDRGATWTSFPTGLAGGDDMLCLTMGEPLTWISMCANKVLLSVDNGSSWSHIADLPNSPTSVVYSGTHFVAFAGNYVHRSSDGISWTTVDLGSHVEDAAISGSTIIAVGNWASMWRSVDHGASWVLLPSAYAGSMVTIATDGEKWIAGGTTGTIQVSDDNGDSWTLVAASVFTGTTHRVKAIACRL